MPSALLSPPNPADPFAAIHRELADAPLSGFQPQLAVNASALVVGQPHAGQCAECCHWSLPLAPPHAGRPTPCGVALHFNEWLVWHWHVVIHQRMPAQITALAAARANGGALLA